MALHTLACSDGPVGITPEPPTEEPVARTLGLMEVSITLGEGEGEGTTSLDGVPSVGPHASANATSLDTITDGIQMEALSVGSFTWGTRGEDGVRYLYATFRVRNADVDGNAYDDARTNLTFIPVETSGTISGTPVSRLLRFDGSNAEPGLAALLKPTGQVHQSTTGQVHASGPDVLQAFTEAEVDTAGGFTVPNTVTTTYPYGFVVRRADGTDSTRTLRASPAADQYDGVVTFAYKLPLQATRAEDPFKVSIIVLAVDDPVTRITESLEEQTTDGRAAFEARAQALGATVVTTLPGWTVSSASTRCLTQVRTAGGVDAVTESLLDRSFAALRLALPGQTITPCGATGTASEQQAGASFDIIVHAVDAQGSPVSGVADSVTLVTDDPQALLPQGVRLVDGTATVPAVLRTAGTPTITAAHATDGAVVSGADAVPVSPGPAVRAHVSAPARVNVGETAIVRVDTAWDAYGNVRKTGGDADVFATTLGTISDPADHGNGTYSASLTMPGTADPTQADTAVVSAFGSDSAAVYLSAWSQVDAGYRHTCGVATDGTAYCWGGTRGLRGSDAFTPGDTPAKIVGGHAWSQVSAGDFNTCGVATDGAGYCWGYGYFGALGNGSNADTDAPSAVSGGYTFSQISTGVHLTCGLTTDGTGYCWGDDTNGQLANGALGDAFTPSPVAGGHVFTEVSAGDEHSCLITTNGEGLCAGWSEWGKLGTGIVDDTSSTPKAIAGSHTFTRISAGLKHTCGVTADGSAYCWGDGSLGEIGDNGGSDRAAPSEVSGSYTFAHVSTGYYHSCGVTTDGTAYCWGYDQYGQLGNGSAGMAYTPSLVSGAHLFRQVSAGRNHTCGVTTGGRAYCWGYGGDHQLGTGSTANATTPTRVLIP